jgi:hypothetical protein
LKLLSVLVLDMIEILPPLGKYKYDTWRILPVKYYINNSMCLQSCIRNVNMHHIHAISKKGKGTAGGAAYGCKDVGHTKRQAHEPVPPRVVIP